MTPRRPDLCANHRPGHEDVPADTIIIWPSNGHRVPVCYPCGGRLMARFLGHPRDRTAWAIDMARTFTETLARSQRRRTA